MTHQPNNHHKGIEHESDFEASLTIPHDADLLSAETRIVEPKAEAPKPAAVPDAKQPAWIGKKMGQFKLLRLIGQGNMGMVIQAVDVNLQRIVALKVLRKKIMGERSEKHVEQFLREARAAARIEHPNVVHIYEINQHQGWWYIAMEMVQGDSLKRVIEAAGPLPPRQACPLIADAATALDIAHREGLIHRDIKPANLMITRNGRCKLTDFGLVRMGDPNDPFEFTSKTVGTPFFMAPEIIRRQKQTPAIDVYSLGCTLYYALTGTPPYKGKDMPDLLRKHLKEPIPDIRDKVPDASAGLSSLITRMLAKDPLERPSAADVAAALHAESIGSLPIESSGMSSTAESSILTEAIEKALDSYAEASGSRIFSKSSTGQAALSNGDQNRKMWIAVAKGVGVVTAAVLLIFISSVLVDSNSSSPKKPSAQGLRQRFPDAPDTYGVLAPGSGPRMPGNLSQPPAFSWIGKIDAADFQYVASREGVYYYAKDDPAAALITADNFVGYKTARQALTDGKTPAP